MPREVGKRRFDRNFKQHLVNVSNELFLHDQRCQEYNRPFPHSMSQAHALVRKELERIREGRGKTGCRRSTRY